MKRMILAVALMTCFNLNAKEIEVESKVESISMFKNGLGVVRRVIKIAKDGDYMLTDVPRPVHGTFWVESNAQVVTRCTKRKFDEPMMLSQKGITVHYGGKNVTIKTSGETSTTIKGVVMVDEDPLKEKWNRTYKQNYQWNRQNLNQTNAQTARNADGNYLTIKTANGVMSIKTSIISSIRSDSINMMEKVIKPVMIFHATGVPEKGGLITISYLSKGISWAPSYKMDLGQNGTMKIELKAVIKNEMTEFADTKVKLISGYPNIKFSHVDSPISLTRSLSSFFQQLSQRHQSSQSSMSNVISQQAVVSNLAAPSSASIDMSQSSGDGVDIHYQDIGKLSMFVGDSLALSVAVDKTKYERLIHWNIADNRNECGYIGNTRWRENPEKYGNAAWDSIRFKNPYKFPMTTAVASIYESDLFLGQSLSYWVNPGSENLLHFTKALSIIKKHSEKELAGKRKRQNIQGLRYDKTTVEGRVFIKNSRNKKSKIIIDRFFSGKLIKADGKPHRELLEAGVYSVNECRKLTWEFPLKAGEEKELVYRYSVLVRH